MTSKDAQNRSYCTLHDSKANSTFCFLQIIILAYDGDSSGSVVGGNKKGLVGRMTMIQNALDSSDLGKYFTYP